jgi:lactate dehydrogenase-like 2-hydroxyacid dehydrogenase
VLWSVSPTQAQRPEEGRGRESDAPEGLSKEIAMSKVTVIIGAGSIGQAIARRVSAGKHVLDR